jgi:hypothetical protein
MMAEIFLIGDMMAEFDKHTIVFVMNMIVFALECGVKPPFGRKPSFRY